MRSVHVRRDSRRSIRVAAMVLGLGLVATAGGCGGDTAEDPGRSAAEQPTRTEPAGESRSKATESSETKDSGPTPPPDRLPEPEPPADPYERELYNAASGFYEAVTESYRTLDAAPIDAVELPGSGSGKFYRDQLKDLQSKGHRFSHPPRFVLRDFHHARDGSELREMVTFQIWSGPAVVVDDAGEIVDSDPGGDGEREGLKGRITLIKEGDKWLIAEQSFD